MTTVIQMTDFKQRQGARSVSTPIRNKTQDSRTPKTLGYKPKDKIEQAQKRLAAIGFNETNSQTTVLLSRTEYAELLKASMERDAAVELLAEWCVSVELNGTSWDDWDEHYKDARYRPGLLRERLDTEIEKEKATR
jgi:hypothetical protein